MREFSEQDKQRISKQFCSFCCSVLKNEANNIRAEYKHYADLEMDFSFLSDKEQAELYTFDCYFVTDNVFNVCDIRIIVSNNMLAEAINKLPCDLRDIVLLSYFANMPDIEIAKQLLLNTSLHIEDIAYSIGYQNPEYFSNLFKHRCGVSPRNFRNQRNRPESTNTK